MHISFSELRSIKHSLPTGSIQKIADQLNMSEQSVRNYFGAKKYQNGTIVGKHIQPGPDGGFVELEDNQILDLAKQLISQTEQVNIN